MATRLIQNGEEVQDILNKAAVLDDDVDAVFGNCPGDGSRLTPEEWLSKIKLYIDSCNSEDVYVLNHFPIVGEDLSSIIGDMSSAKLIVLKEDTVFAWARLAVLPGDAGHQLYGLKFYPEDLYFSQIRYSINDNVVGPITEQDILTVDHANDTFLKIADATRTYLTKAEADAQFMKKTGGTFSSDVFFAGGLTSNQGRFYDVVTHHEIVNMSNKKIVNVGNPTSDGDAVNAGWVRVINDLANYYLKSETYTKSEVNALIGAIQNFHYEVYPSISSVTNPSNNVLYLIGPTGTGSDKYKEYVYDPTKPVAERWIKIGDTSIDLSGYMPKSGGTFTGTVYFEAGEADLYLEGNGIDMEGPNNRGKIMGLGNPSDDYDAAHKKYVDDSVSDAKVFWATFRSTTYSAVMEAKAAGKAVMMEYNGSIWHCSAEGDTVKFFTIDGQYLKEVSLTSSGWDLMPQITILESSMNKTNSVSDPASTTNYPSVKGMVSYAQKKMNKTFDGIKYLKIDAYYGNSPFVAIIQAVDGDTNRNGVWLFNYDGAMPGTLVKLSSGSDDSVNWYWKSGEDSGGNYIYELSYGALGSPYNAEVTVFGENLTQSLGLISSGSTSSIVGTANSVGIELQEKLVSGTNIKTVNNNSLLGSGNLTIEPAKDYAENDPSDGEYIKNRPGGYEEELGDNILFSDTISFYEDDRYDIPLSCFNGSSDKVTLLRLMKAGITIPCSYVPDDGTLVGQTLTGELYFDSYYGDAYLVHSIEDDGSECSSWEVQSSSIEGAYLDENLMYKVPVQFPKRYIPKEMFLATYGSTTCADLIAAWDAGMFIVVKDSDGYLYVPNYETDDGDDKWPDHFVSYSPDEGVARYCSVDSDDTWSKSSADTKEVFWATYGTTTYQQVIDANTAGKVCFVVSGQHILRLSRVQASAVAFSSQIGTYLYRIDLANNDNWGSLQIFANELSSNKKTSVADNRTSDTYYPTTKAVYDFSAKYGIISQTQTWSGSGSNPRTYVMSDQVWGAIPKANIDLFEAAGATFNAVTGYFELNGLTDISYEEMTDIYNAFSGDDYRRWARKFVGINCRTNLPANWFGFASASDACEDRNFTNGLSYSKVEVVVIPPKVGTTFFETATLSSFMYNNPYIRSVINPLKYTGTAAPTAYAFNSPSLVDIELNAIKWSFAIPSPNLSKASLLYMINNEASTGAITITLNSSVYAKCQSGGDWYSDVSAALSSHTNISLASA